MNMRNATVALAVTAAAGTAMATASPASAGGVGDFLSPAFGTTCIIHGSHDAKGATTRETGTVTGNLLGLPLGAPLNECGGADFVTSSVNRLAVPGTGDGSPLIALSHGDLAHTA